MDDMYVPIELVRCGLAEDYIRLIERKDTSYKKELDAIQKHSDLSRKLYETMSGGMSKRNRPHVCAYSLGVDRVWTHAMMVAELSNELAEMAGKIVEARSEYNAIEAELEALGNDD
jgi:hypothetical protein